MTNASEAYKYRVFISYSHRDDKWARWLHRALERYRPPAGLADQVPSTRGKPRRITPVFRDREELPTSASLSEAVNNALEESENLVVICSPSAAQSHWVNEEILAFKNLGRANRIFCLVVDGEPFSGDEDECFAQALKFECATDGSLSEVPAEPLAADARPSGDGRTLAKLKLIAGLLGVGLDDLRQRDLQRRHQRLLAITAGSVAMTVLTLSLAISAYLSNIEAERRRAQAEDLISFLVEDLYYGLHEIGRLDVFTSVGNKAMEYFSQLTDEDVDATVLKQRALALQQIGNTRFSQGAMEEALDSFNEALAVSQRLAAMEPSNPQAQISLANSLFWVGFVHWQRGNLAQAGEFFAREIPLVDSVVSSEPDNAEWLQEQAYAYTNYARVLELQGQLAESLELYESIAKINGQLLAMEPDNADYKLEVGFAHNNLGKVLQSIGRIEEAGRHYDRDFQIKRELLESNPNHNLWRYYLAKSQAFIGRNRAALGELGQSAAAYGEALEIVRFLRRMESGETKWHGDLATFRQELAAVELNRQQYGEAERLLQQSLEAWEDLLAIDDERVKWQGGQGLAWIDSARLLLVNGDPRGAEEWAVRAMRRFQALYQSNPGNLENLKHRALAGLVLGDAEKALDREAASATWQEALDILADSPVITIHPEHLELRVALLHRLGRQDLATADLARLDGMNYYSSLVSTARDLPADS